MNKLFKLPIMILILLATSIACYAAYPPQAPIDDTPVYWSGVSGLTGSIWRTGNVGIGTTDSPTDQLEVYGNIKTRYLKAWDLLGLGFKNAEGTLCLHIADNGNVLIASFFPMYPSQDKLHIEGGISLGDYIKAKDGNGLKLQTDEGTTRLTIADDGNIGIGTTEPGAKLDVEVSGGGIATIGSSSNVATGDYAIAMGSGTTASGTYSTAMGYETTASGYYSTAMGISTTASGSGSTAMGGNTTASGGVTTAMGRDIIVSGIYSFGIGLDNTARTVSAENVMAIMGGNVGIGEINPQSKLAVNGTITTKEIEVTIDGWSDFVFDSNYDLKSLDEVEQFISENGHLPEIPSAEEVKENGLNLGNMQAKLLQKIEELTLYVIELKKDNDELRIKVDGLSK